MPKKYFWAIFIIFALVLLQFFYSQIKLLVIEDAFDFTTLYTSGLQALNGQNPYLKITNDTVRNPPPAILLYLIWAILPVGTSEVIWFVISFLCFLIGSYFLLKTFELNKDKFFNTKNLALWLIYLVAVLRAFPFRWNLGSGQINNLLFALLAISFYFSQRKKLFISSLALAFGISIKITPLFLLFNLLVQKRLKLFYYTLLSLLLISGLTVFSFFLLGRDIIKDYFSISGLYFDFYTTTYYNQSLASFFTRLTASPALSQTFTFIILGAACTVFGVIFFKTKQTFTNSLLSWNISILYMLIFAPFTWKYHFVIIIFPFLATAYLLYSRKLKFKAWLIFIICYLLVSYHSKSAPTLDQFNFLQALIYSHVLLGAIGLLLLNFHLLKTFQNNKGRSE